MKFRITWPSNKQEVVEQDSATTVEEFCNIHFGSAWDDAQASGVSVELVEDDQQDDQNQ